MKKVYPIQVIGSRFQIDHVNPKKKQLFEEYRGNTDDAHFDANLFTILRERRELGMVSDRNKKIEFKLLYLIVSFNDF